MKWSVFLMVLLIPVTVLAGCPEALQTFYEWNEAINNKDLDTLKRLYPAGKRIVYYDKKVYKKKILSDKSSFYKRNAKFVQIVYGVQCTPDTGGGYMITYRKKAVVGRHFYETSSVLGIRGGKIVVEKDLVTNRIETKDKRMGIDDVLPGGSGKYVAGFKVLGKLGYARMRCVWFRSTGEEVIVDPIYCNVVVGNKGKLNVVFVKPMPHRSFIVGRFTPDPWPDVFYFGFGGVGGGTWGATHILSSTGPNQWTSQDLTSIWYEHFEDTPAFKLKAPGVIDVGESLTSAPGFKRVYRTFKWNPLARKWIGQ